MKTIINLLCFIFCACACASEVQWNCFSLHDLWEANSIGCYYYDAYSTPEIGLRYTYGSNGSVSIDGKGDSNVGCNIAIWVNAVVGDILDRSYFSQEHIVLKDSYNELVPSPIELNSTGEVLNVSKYKRFYLALIGYYYGENGATGDYYGWVELRNTGTEITILGSAFSYGNIVVGGGAVPESSSALLVLLGCAGLLLRRRRNSF